ncbi:MAG: outer membrane lipoprotein LolB, partial [Proteobacteria bacterium]|nr:outer membrane lipoprotein LolB [Pseudomonadota bacterium]
MLAALGSALLAACAQPPRPASGAADHWSGRLALQVEDAAAQSFSAGFELQG